MIDLFLKNRLNALQRPIAINPIAHVADENILANTVLLAFQVPCERIVPEKIIKSDQRILARQFIWITTAHKRTAVAYKATLVASIHGVKRLQRPILRLMLLNCHFSSIEKSDTAAGTRALQHSKTEAKGRKLA